MEQEVDDGKITQAYREKRPYGYGTAQSKALLHEVPRHVQVSLGHRHLTQFVQVDGNQFPDTGGAGRGKPLLKIITSESICFLIIGGAPKIRQSGGHSLRIAHRQLYCQSLLQVVSGGGIIPGPDCQVAQIIQAATKPCSISGLSVENEALLQVVLRGSVISARKGKCTEHCYDLCHPSLIADRLIK